MTTKKKDEFSVGDIVFYEHGRGYGVPAKLVRRTVTKVEVVGKKKSIKVTLDDDTVWDASYFNHAWGTRSNNHYAGASLMQYTDALQARCRRGICERWLQWAVKETSTLSDDHVERIARVILECRAELKKATEAID